MPLDSLLTTVESLRERIDAHGDALRQNEALTRYALIDPLLRELGWDTSDPALVTPEYRSGDGSADYALLHDNRPAIMVEAKKLDTPLRDKVLSQGITYCLTEGTPHFTVTDGRRWEVYETHKPVPIADKLVVSFDLNEQPPAEVCLQALALWRPAVEAAYVVPGHPPIIEPAHSPPGSTQSPPTSAVVTPLVAREHEWHSLAEVTADSGQAPIEVLFPDSESIESRNWRDALEETVRWLTIRGILQASNCPIIGRSPNATRHMVHTQPIHSDGARFRVPAEVNGLWVEKHGRRQAVIAKIKTIIQHVGQDPAQFKVRFD